MSLRRPFVKLLAVAASVGLVAAACGSDDQGGGGATSSTASQTAASRGSAEGPLEVATILSTSGQLAPYGPGVRTAVELAVKDMNDAGGVLGKPVSLEANLDDGTDADKAQTAADQVINSSKSQALIGAMGSSVSSAIIGKVTGAGILMCSPSNTAAALTSKDDNGGFYFRTAPSDDLQGPALADLVTGDGYKKIAIIARNDDYGKGFASSLEDNLKQSGATVTANVSYDPQAPDLNPDVQKVLQSNPEAVIAISFVDDGAKVLTGLIQGGFGPADKPVYTADGMQGSTVSKDGAIDQESLGYLVNPQDPFQIDGLGGTAPSSDPSAEFKARFEAVKSPQDQNAFTGQGYDCATILGLAAEAAKSAESSKMLPKVIAVADDKGEVCTSFKDCKALLDQGKDIAYKGAVGEIAMTQAGDPSVGNYDVWKLEQGRVVVNSTITQR